MIPLKWNKMALLCAAVLLVACELNLDSDFKGITASSTMVVPLAYGNLSIQDFLGDADSANIRIYDSGPDKDVVYLYYEQTLKTQEIGGLLTIDDRTITKDLNINPTAVAIPVPANAQDQQLASGIISFDLGLDPEKLQEVLFTQGNLQITATTTPAIPNLEFEGIIALPSFRKNNIPLQQTVQTNAQAQSVSIANYLALLNENLFNVSVTVIVKRHNTTSAIPPGTRFNVSLQFNALNFDYITGFFGEQTADLPSETLKLGTFENSFEEGNVSFADPRISFEVVNEYGIPVSVIFNELEARNNSGSLDVTLNPSSPIVSAFPTVRGDSAFTNVSVTNANQLLDFEPTEFRYNVSAVINQGLTSGLNFCERDNELKVRMKIEVPFIGHASDIVIRDTVDIDISDADASDIETASLRIKAVNNIPVAATLQIYLLDEKGILIDKLLTDDLTVVNGAVTDATGNSITPGVFDADIEINKEKINKLFEAKQIIIASRLQTADNPKDVRFKSTDKLNVNLGLKVKLNLQAEL